MIGKRIYCFQNRGTHSGAAGLRPDAIKGTYGILKCKMQFQEDCAFVICEVEIRILIKYNTQLISGLKGILKIKGEGEL